MKIIKKGNYNPKKLIKTECDTCDSVLEYTEDEIMYNEHSTPYITCLVCNKNIYGFQVLDQDILKKTYVVI